MTQSPPVPANIPLKYSRDLKLFQCNGIDLNSPIDSIKDGFYPILENVRSYTDGVIQPRLGLTEVANAITSQTPVHSIRRLNNPLNSTYTRVVGSGTKLATGQTSFTNVQHNGSDVAFSGAPLAMVPWRPDQSPVSWMYVADSSAMYKITYNGSAVTTHKIGIAPPTAAPVVELAAPRGPSPDTSIGNISGGIFTTTTDWTVSGISGAISTGTVFTGRGITAVLFDTGTSGWCSIVPASMADIGPGTLIEFTPGIGVFYGMASEIYRAASPANNTVATILYDNNPTNTGACTIVPSSTVTELRRNSVVQLNGGTNYFRVTEVITGADNTVVAFKCNTGATTIAATNSLVVVDSFRMYSYVTSTDLNTGTTMLCDRNFATFTPSGANLIGALRYTFGTNADMTQLGTTGAVGVTDLDYIHFAFKCPDLSQVVQIRVKFDVDDDSFTRNFYYRAIRSSDLVTSAKATQTTIAARNTQVANEIISFRDARSGFRDNAFTDGDVLGPSEEFSGSVLGDLYPREALPDLTGVPGDQTGTGDSQWHHVRFRRGDCIRVGTDWSKGWKSVGAVEFEVSMISGGSAGAMEFSSLVLWGSASPDIGDIGSPYLYRYRYRSSVTGAASNWSPATRSGVIALRNRIAVTCTSSSEPAAEVDLIDIQRWGGLVAAWADVGTVLDSSATFTDTSDDDAAFATLPDSVLQVNYQPWISSQTPTSGTATTVAGTMIKDSGTSFNTGWVAGTGIKVNGLHTTIRRVISTSLLEVEDCVGSGSTIAWEIAEPFLRTNLPCLWGPVNGFFFACGDSTNPGRLYWSNLNNPDSTQDTFYIDVTAPSEPLMNGFSYNGRNYVFSSENLYEIVEISQGQFIARVTPVGRGLMYRWAFTVGPRVWFLAKDGVYETDGGNATSITLHNLYSFFPKEGQAGTATNGFFPPNITTGNLTISGITADASRFFRLAYYDNYLYFVYPDTNNRIRVLTYRLGSLSLTQGASNFGWFPDVFNPGGNNTGVFCIYGEEGTGIHNILMGGAEGTTAKVYSYGGNTDNGTAISWTVRTPSWDLGEKRADKDWKDLVISADAGGGTITVAAGVNEYSSNPTLNNPSTGASTITGSSRTKATFDINTGNGVEARNFAVNLSGTGTGARLYFLETAVAPRPEDTFRRATQYDDCGYPGEKWMQGIEIEADTQNVAKALEIQYDGGTVGDTLSITNNGRRLEPYSFASGFVARLVRLAPSDNDLWKLYRWKWTWEPEPPLVTTWDTQQTSHGHTGFIHLKEIWITHTSTADLTLTITRMDDNTSQSYTITNSGGVRGLETRLLLGPADFCKGKTFKYKITQASNTPFRIYQKNCSVFVKPWGSAQGYARWSGWGAQHGDGAAQI